MPYQAVGPTAHHAARALHGFEGAGERPHSFEQTISRQEADPDFATAIVKRQESSTVAPTTVPTTLVVSNQGGVTTLSLTDTGDAEQAISTLLSAYSSADQTLASANSAAVQSISDFIRAQESINSVLSAGGTPVIAGNSPSIYSPCVWYSQLIIMLGLAAPVTVTPVTRPTTGTPSGVISSRNTTSLAPSSSTTASSSQAPTGAASRTAHAKFGLIGLISLAASYVAFAV
jgi:hypothetical protein